MKKLGATPIDSRNKAHDEYLVQEGGIQIAIISIRRGSEMDKGHDYIPKEIHVGPNIAKDLANCPKSRPQYLAHLQEIGILPNSDASA